MAYEETPNPQHGAKITKAHFPSVVKCKPPGKCGTIKPKNKESATKREWRRPEVKAIGFSKKHNSLPRHNFISIVVKFYQNSFDQIKIFSKPGESSCRTQKTSQRLGKINDSSSREGSAAS
jgi:hypothetical protein